ncbi:flagellar biosynthesis protein FliS [Photobacterium ganghwense]|uniref:flagellar biosynthesis protein FliS n=1 Tax=Photobacterium ganghwense TaxID=320778 RepID=UPI0040575784
MKELAQLELLEQRIQSLVNADEYADDFPELLEQLVAQRHAIVKDVLSNQEALTRPVFDDIQQRTQTLKALLEKNKAVIKQKLLKAKQAKKSVSVYKMFNN